ncbi:unnamed protein product [Moneuplotes crassus]|uniref:Uncharacterized protein n=1 Tax=Euplotes crassus TaxID=5936 RepID=A0AAD2D9F4_EUPCR|nr:unnamed protein product [Moneuplotes crassus]
MSSKSLSIRLSTSQDRTLKSLTIYGIFSYKAKSFTTTHISTSLTPQLFMRVGDQVQTFCDIRVGLQAQELANRKNNDSEEEKYIKSQVSFLFCLIHEANGPNVYAYNQLVDIFGYLSDHIKLNDIDPQIYSLFGKCETIKEAREILDRFHVESSSKDLWKTKNAIATKLKKLQAKTLGCEIKEGDIVRIGRLKMKLIKLESSVSDIRDISIQNINEDSKTYSRGSFIEPGSPKKVTDKDKPICRFCLSCDNPDKDPLFNACKCKGTQGLIHLQCLRSWMNSFKKHKVLSNLSEEYHWKTTTCEICKASYTLQIEHEGTLVDLLEYKKPEEAYCVFETLHPKESDRFLSKSLFVHQFKNPEIKRKYKTFFKNQQSTFTFGRADEAEFRFNDQSVSRIHGEITLTNESRLFIKDYDSRFGTQVLMNLPQTVDQNNSLNNVFQIGRTWMHLSLIESHPKAECCCFFRKANKVVAKEIVDDDNKENTEFRIASLKAYKSIPTLLDKKVADTSKERKVPISQTITDSYPNKILVSSSVRENSSRPFLPPMGSHQSPNENDQQMKVEATSKELDYANSFDEISAYNINNFS